MFFRESPVRARRLREFIRSDVLALMEIQRNDGQWNGFMETIDEEILSNLIIRSMSMYEIMGDDILRTYLGQYTEQFCYELYYYSNNTVTNDHHWNEGDDSRQNDLLEFEMAFNQNTLKYGDVIESNVEDEESAENSLRRSLLETSMVIEESDETMFRSFLVNLDDTVGSLFTDQPSTSMGTILSSEPQNDAWSSTSDRNTGSQGTTIGFRSSGEESETFDYDELIRGKRKRRMEKTNNKRSKKSISGRPNIMRRRWYDYSSSPAIPTE